MKTALYRGKRTLKQWQQDRQADYHHERLKGIRPLCQDFEWDPPILNQGKKLMQQQDKFNSIERENRYLLEKISTTMRKKSQWESDKQRMGRSLNAPFRRRQLESIEVENARLLKRIQEKKSDYNTKKLKQDWKKQKEVIKNIAFYPFIIRTNNGKGTKRRPISMYKNELNYERGSSLSGEIEMVRARTLEGEGFVVTIKMDEEVLKIIGERRKTKQKKIIEIPKEEAMIFIDEECGGKIQGLFDKLSFDAKEGVMYLIGHIGQGQLSTINENKVQLEEETVRGAGQ